MAFVLCLVVVFMCAGIDGTPILSDIQATVEKMTDRMGLLASQNVELSAALQKMAQQKLNMSYELQNLAVQNNKLAGLFSELKDENDGLKKDILNGLTSLTRKVDCTLNMSSTTPCEDSPFLTVCINYLSISNVKGKPKLSIPARMGKHVTLQWFKRGRESILGRKTEKHEVCSWVLKIRSLKDRWAYTSWIPTLALNARPIIIYRDIFDQVSKRGGGNLRFVTFFDKFWTFWKKYGLFCMPQGSEVQVS